MGGRALFLVAEDDSLTPHYGHITLSRGQARLLLWEGSSLVCDAMVAVPATSAG